MAPNNGSGVRWLDAMCIMILVLSKYHYNTFNNKMDGARTVYLQ